MKKLVILILTFSLFLPTFAEISTRRIKNPPQGTFKKTKNGKIIQYDQNGKKIGIYKLESRQYKKR